MLDLLYKRLSEDTSITALVSDRIYPYIREEQTDTPAVMFEIVSTSFLDTMSTTSKSDKYSVQVTCVAKKAQEAQSLSNLVRTNLDGLKGSIAIAGGPTYHVASARVISIDLDSRLNGRIFAAELDFDFDILTSAASIASGGVMLAQSSLSAEDMLTLDHFRYNPTTDKLEADRAIETTLNSLFLGEQHKMSSGSENIFFTNLSSDINFFPMWGGLKDQSIVANQGASGFIPPSGRVFSDMFSLPLRGNPDPLTAVAYEGLNYFGVNISGLGITTVAAEEVPEDVRLEYRIKINGKNVYKQVLPRNAPRSSAALHIYPNDTIEWFFDHPVDVRAGTNLHAEIHKVRQSDDVDLGAFLVRQGDTANPDGSFQYQAIVHNRLFEDKDLELISPYLKYKAMDFGLDATGSTVLFRDLTLTAAENLLIPHAVNTVEAVANGTEIQIKIKGGSKVLVESLPVNAVTLNGAFVNSVLNTAVTQLNDLFTATQAFSSGGSGNPVNDFALSGNNLTITLLDGTSFTQDVTTLGVDENNFVSSGTLSGTDLILTMDDASTLTIDAAGLAIDTDVTVTSGAMSGTDLVLTLSDASTVTIDASTLSGGSGTGGNDVVSGSVIGTDLVLVLSDASQITIDASNMVNGSSLSSLDNSWYISHGTNADTTVNVSTVDNTVKNQQPFYFGNDIARGEEFRWNVDVSNQQRFGIWDGAEIANTYQAGTTLNNWSTCFSFLNGGTRFVDATNTSVSAHHSGTQYVVSAGDALAIRFKSDGHLELWDLSDTFEVLIASTITPLASQTFKLQYGSWQYATFPNGSVLTTQTEYWNIVHDFNTLEGGVYNGIKDHTVIQSTLGIDKGQKFMFNLDMNGTNQYFGLDWLGGASGVSNAETNVERRFRYDTAEGFQAFQGWTLDATNPYYLSSALWRPLQGVPVGMCSLRYMHDDSVELWHETNPATRIAYTTTDWTGNTIYPVLGSSGNISYDLIPTISVQSLDQSTQPNTAYAPTVANQSFSVTELDTVNAQLVASDYIVNHWVETDAPSWLTLNQSTGVFSGTAPAFAGTSADTIVVNCKAGNAVGGSTDFTVTITVQAVSYTNTKSLRFPVGGSAYLNGSAANVASLQRVSNGSGSSDAWTISMWVKPDATSQNEQQLFYYGGDDMANKGFVSLTCIQGTISMSYGKTSNRITLVGMTNLPVGQWNHILLSYDGGTTGVASADVANYLGRFTLLVDGANAVTHPLHVNYGWDGSILTNRFRIGKGATGNTYNADGLIVNQVAIWNSDQSASSAGIYNGGATQDLTSISSVSGTMAGGYVAPDHYYEIDSSVTTVSDINGNAHFTGLNFSSSDLVTDAP